MLEVANPAFGDFADGYGIDEMKSFPSLAPPGHEIGLLENRQVFCHRLPGHTQATAEFPQGLTISLAQAVEKLAPARIRQCFENRVIAHRLIGNHSVP